MPCKPCSSHCHTFSQSALCSTIDIFEYDFHPADETAFTTTSHNPTDVSTITISRLTLHPTGEAPRSCVVSSSPHRPHTQITIHFPPSPTSSIPPNANPSNLNLQPTTPAPFQSQILPPSLAAASPSPTQPWQSITPILHPAKPQPQPKPPTPFPSPSLPLPPYTHPGPLPLPLPPHPLTSSYPPPHILHLRFSVPLPIHITILVTCLHVYSPSPPLPPSLPASIPPPPRSEKHRLDIHPFAINDSTP